MARRTKAEAAQTREVILDAAERLFADQGIAGTALDDIAKQAGVTRGAIYWHFEGKIALFQAMQERVKLPLEEMMQQLDKAPDVIVALEEFCIYTLQYVVRDKRMQCLFNTILFGGDCGDMDCLASMQQQKRLEVIERFQKVFTQAKKAGHYTGSLSPRNAAIALKSFVWGLCADYLQHPEGNLLGRHSPALVRSFFIGLQA